MKVYASMFNRIGLAVVILVVSLCFVSPALALNEPITQENIDTLEVLTGTYACHRSDAYGGRVVSVKDELGHITDSENAAIGGFFHVPINQFSYHEARWNYLLIDLSIEQIRQEMATAPWYFASAYAGMISTYESIKFSYAIGHDASSFEYSEEELSLGIQEAFLSYQAFMDFEKSLDELCN